uniref:Uncharacterized protein n=1 Tax=Aegilops tauschii subsp. strangulata TaxID=200361 RepID=A0A453H562_AEGTS
KTATDRSSERSEQKRPTDLAVLHALARTPRHSPPAG